jgi:CheY-like chemotaxis protein
MIQAGGFDIVLCDMMMPEFSGIQLWEALDERQREVFVFMTGGTYTDDARSFLARNQPRVLAKPFTSDSVAGLLREVARPQPDASPS